MSVHNDQKPLSEYYKSRHVACVFKPLPAVQLCQMWHNTLICHFLCVKYTHFLYLTLVHQLKKVTHRYIEDKNVCQKTHKNVKLGSTDLCLV